jgi:hypothetical protein
MRRAVVAALALMALNPSAAKAGGLCDERPQLSEFELRVLDAIRSRAAFGFRHDRPYVIWVLRHYRRGLTPAERDYLRLRNRLQVLAPIVSAYVGSLPAGVSAGVALADSPGRPLVLVRVTRDAALHQAELRRRFPYPENVDVVEVPYSLDLLRGLFSRVFFDRQALRQAGFHVLGGGVDIGANRANVLLITRRPDAQAYFEARYGPVQVELIARTLTSRRCTSPNVYTLSRDGRTLRVFWTTHPSSRLIRVRTRRGRRELRLGVVERIRNGGGAGIAVSRHALVRLRQPLGPRGVVGATSGLPVGRVRRAPGPL